MTKFLASLLLITSSLLSSASATDSMKADEDIIAPAIKTISISQPKINLREEVVGVIFEFLPSENLIDYCLVNKMFCKAGKSRLTFDSTRFIYDEKLINEIGQHNPKLFRWLLNPIQLIALGIFGGPVKLLESRLVPPFIKDFVMSPFNSFLASHIGNYNNVVMYPAHLGAITKHGLKGLTLEIKYITEDHIGQVLEFASYASKNRCKAFFDLTDFEGGLDSNFFKKMPDDFRFKLRVESIAKANRAELLPMIAQKEGSIFHVVTTSRNPATGHYDVDHLDDLQDILTFAPETPSLSLEVLYCSKRDEYFDLLKKFERLKSVCLGFDVFYGDTENIQKLQEGKVNIEFLHLKMHASDITRDLIPLQSSNIASLSFYRAPNWSDEKEQATTLDGIENLRSVKEVNLALHEGRHGWDKLCFLTPLRTIIVNKNQLNNLLLLEGHPNMERIIVKIVEVTTTRDERGNLTGWDLHDKEEKYLPDILKELKGRNQSSVQS